MHKVTASCSHVCCKAQNRELCLGKIQSSAKKQRLSKDQRGHIFTPLRSNCFEHGLVAKEGCLWVATSCFLCHWYEIVLGLLSCFETLFFPTGKIKMFFYNKCCRYYWWLFLLTEKFCKAMLKLWFTNQKLAPLMIIILETLMKSLLEFSISQSVGHKLMCSGSWLDSSKHKKCLVGCVSLHLQAIIIGTGLCASAPHVSQVICFSARYCGKWCMEKIIQYGVWAAEMPYGDSYYVKCSVWRFHPKTNLQAIDSFGHNLFEY